MEIIEIILYFLFFALSILMVILILLQNNRGSGLSGFFTGGASQTPFGASAGDILAKITGWMGAVYFLICLGFAMLYYHKPTTAEEVEKKIEQEKALQEKPKMKPSQTQKKEKAKKDKAK